MTPDLEIGLFRLDEADYAVDLRFTNDADVLEEPVRERIAFDVTGLEITQDGDAATCGRLLAERLFAAAAIRDRYLEIRKATVGRGGELRVRISIDRAAPALHALPWETIHDPETNRPLLECERIFFSRFLHAGSGRGARLRAKDVLRAFVFIASPSDLARRRDGNTMLHPIDVEGERARVTTAMAPVAPKIVATDPAVPGNASIGALVAGLRDAPDLFYLVCHGAAASATMDARVYLEADAGDRTPGATRIVLVEELANRINDLGEAPAVVVLGACKSAVDDTVTGGRAVLSALGPRLIDAGALAVVAMQGNISMQTASAFAAHLFGQLREHGEIDRAVAVARSQLRDRPDAWMPVLFSRLRRGTIWYTPSFGAPGDAPWRSLVSSVEQRLLVPFVGPGLMEPILGSADAIAHDFAIRTLQATPLGDWDDLPRLAQYRATVESRDLMRDEVRALLQARVRRAIGERDGVSLEDGLAEAWKTHAAQEPDEAHQFLASLGLPVYITANIDDSLSHALRARGVEPIIEVLRWNNRMGLDEYGQRRPSKLQRRAGGEGTKPSPQTPLVYHLFGHIADPESLVLSEDDFFDYLMWSQSPESDVPTAVTAAWTRSPLLFLGFRLEDWRFRVMFRSVLTDERRGASRKYKSVAAQVVPEEGGVPPMRDYLERQLRAANIEIYWGRVPDFVRSFAAQLKAPVNPR